MMPWVCLGFGLLSGLLFARSSTAPPSRGSAPASEASARAFCSWQSGRWETTQASWTEVFLNQSRWVRRHGFRWFLFCEEKKIASITSSPSNANSPLAPSGFLPSWNLSFMARREERESTGVPRLWSIPVGTSVHLLILGTILGSFLSLSLCNTRVLGIRALDHFSHRWFLSVFLSLWLCSDAYYSHGPGKWQVSLLFHLVIGEFL